MKYLSRLSGLKFLPIQKIHYGQYKISLINKWAISEEKKNDIYFENIYQRSFWLTHSDAFFCKLSGHSFGYSTETHYIFPPSQVWSLILILLAFFGWSNLSLDSRLKLINFVANFSQTWSLTKLRQSTIAKDSLRSMIDLDSSWHFPHKSVSRVGPETRLSHLPFRAPRLAHFPWLNLSSHWFS